MYTVCHFNNYNPTALLSTLMEQLVSAHKKYPITTFIQRFIRHTTSTAAESLIIVRFVSSKPFLIRSYCFLLTSWMPISDEVVVAADCLMEQVALLLCSVVIEQQGVCILHDSLSNWDPIPRSISDWEAISKCCVVIRVVLFELEDAMSATKPKLSND